MWNPVVTVTLGGIDFTDDTLARVSITYGRTDITQNIRAGFANVQIITDWNGIIISGNFLDIGDSIEIKMDKSVGHKILFTGTVSDYTVSVESPDVLIYTIVAVSGLAKLSRSNIGADGYPAEYQGERIRRILNYGNGGKTWGQSTNTWGSATYAWGTGTVSGTFANGFDFGLETSDPMAALQALYKAAQFGFFFEKGDGTVEFFDFYSRTGTGGYHTISGSSTMKDNLNAEMTSGQVANDVTVIAFDGTEYSGTDEASILQYGIQQETFDTYMSNATQLNTVENNYLDDWSTARLFVSGFTFPLSTLSTVTRDLLIDVKGNERYLISNVPYAIKNDSLGGTNYYRGIVEGWQWNIIKGEAFLNVALSDWELNQVFV